MSLSDAVVLAFVFLAWLAWRLVDATLSDLLRYLQGRCAVTEAESIILDEQIRIRRDE